MSRSYVIPKTYFLQTSGNNHGLKGPNRLIGDKYKHKCQLNPYSQFCLLHRWRRGLCCLYSRQRLRLPFLEPFLRFGLRGRRFRAKKNYERAGHGPAWPLVRRLSREPSHFELQSRLFRGRLFLGSLSTCEGHRRPGPVLCLFWGPVRGRVLFQERRRSLGCEEGGLCPPRPPLRGRFGFLRSKKLFKKFDLFPVLFHGPLSVVLRFSRLVVLFHLLQGPNSPVRLLQGRPFHSHGST